MRRADEDTATEDVDTIAATSALRLTSIFTRQACSSWRLCSAPAIGQHVADQNAAGAAVEVLLRQKRRAQSAT